jgi:hypothetical protein
MSNSSYYLTTPPFRNPSGITYSDATLDLLLAVLSSNKIVKARISSRFHYFITSKGCPIFDVRLSHPAGHELYPCYLRLLLHTSKEPLRVSTSFVGILIKTTPLIRFAFSNPRGTTFCDATRDLSPLVMSSN